MPTRRSLAAATVAVIALAGAAAGSSAVLPTEDGAQPPPTCGTGGAPLNLSGTVARHEARTYRLLPFRVPAHVGRVEVGYEWRDAAPTTDVAKTVLDLGLWDSDGYRSARGFRGWSGSRQGVLPRQAPVFVQEGAAERGYVPGPVRPGTWWVELGVAAVGAAGASWRVEIACGPAAAVEPGPRGPVDPAHVVRRGHRWYHGDFHVHGYHSHPDAPPWSGVVAQARAASLDFVAVTEYVTGAHWNELGPVQEGLDDLLLWPGREIITYFGHASALGETPQVLEYRHGFEDVTLRSIQERTVAAGALFQVNHPTIFPGPAFQAFCRGCEFTLGDEIDWDRVATLEVVTGPAVVDPSDGGGPKTPAGTQNPFIDTAIHLWERLLREGHKIAPVSGSDSKGVDPPGERRRKGYGSSATAVWAEELSRPALQRAVRAGHVYVRVRGVDGSPALALEVVGEDGERGTFGDVLHADRAVMSVRVEGGAGQVLRVFRNGRLAHVAPLREAVAHVDVPIRRAPEEEGPLGTFWRVETVDDRSRTTIGNAVFLRGAPPPGGGRAAPMGD